MKVHGKSPFTLVGIQCVTIQSILFYYVAMQLILQRRSLPFKKKKVAWLVGCFVWGVCSVGLLLNGWVLLVARFFLSFGAH